MKILARILTTIWLGVMASLVVILFYVLVTKTFFN